MRIVLLGPPGSGKGELSKRIAHAYQVPIITQSSVVNSVAAEPTELGRMAKEARDTARVSDELLLALLRLQLPLQSLERGYVLVDMPKNAGQADVLDSLLNELASPVDLVLNLQVDPDDLMERLVGHIQCDQCGTHYNLYVNPPLVDGVCDVCGARVSRRPDDYEETIGNRLRIYENQMGPLLQYYQLGGKLQDVDAGCDADALWHKVKQLIDATPSPAPADVAVVADAVAKAPGGAAETARPSSGRAKASAKKASAAKKPVAKKSVSKEVTPEKATAKKATAKKATAKKATAKKVVAKKATAKKAAAKKATAKKATAKKATAKKAAAKKAAAKKAIAKKAIAKKAIAKKATAKKVAAKKVAAKKATAKKATAKKATAKKATAKKATAKKATAKKATAKKVAKKTAKR